LMRLLNGYIKRRPLMDRDGSGVSVLLGLDGFVVRVQLLEETTGEWWLGWRRPRSGPGARRAACGQPATDAVR
jgi:hypothetical protein